MKTNSKVILSMIILTIVTIFDSCNKDETSPGFGGDRIISGQIFLKDTLYGSNYIIPQKNADVLVSFGNYNPSGFNYKITTDANGYYKMEHLMTGNYWITFRYVSASNLIYEKITPAIIIGDDDIKHDDTLELANSHGLLVEVVDSSGNKIPRMSVAVFNNQLLFQQGDTNSSAAKGRTNEYGRIFFQNLPNDTYYILVKDSISNIPFRGTGSYTLNGPNAQEVTIIAGRYPPDGLLIIVKDTVGGFIPNFHVCLFGSPILFQDSSCTGSIFSSRSDVSGKIFFQGIPPMIYYILSKDSIGVVHLLSQDTVNVLPNSYAIKYVEVH